jgi:hypothetical protein
MHAASIWKNDEHLGTVQINDAPVVIKNDIVNLKLNR